MVLLLQYVSVSCARTFKLFTPCSQLTLLSFSLDQGHIDSRLGILVVVAFCRSVVAFSTTIGSRKEGLGYRILGNSAHLHSGSSGHQGYGNDLGWYVVCDLMYASFAWDECDS